MRLHRRHLSKRLLRRRNPTPRSRPHHPPTLLHKDLSLAHHSPLLIHPSNSPSNRNKPYNPPPRHSRPLLHFLRNFSRRRTNWRISLLPRHPPSTRPPLNPQQPLRRLPLDSRPLHLPPKLRPTFLSPPPRNDVQRREDRFSRYDASPFHPARNGPRKESSGDCC